MMLKFLRGVFFVLLPLIRRIGGEDLSLKPACFHSAVLSFTRCLDVKLLWL